jgi:hypothetical protein
MHQNCQHCTRLWAEYALATRHYLKLEQRLQMANLSNDRKAIAELTPSLERATAERSELRRLIQEHEQLPQAEAARA